MSRNLLKRNDTCVQQDDKRVINVNELMAKRIEELAAKVRYPENEGFVAGLKTEQVELPSEEGEEGSNVIHTKAIEEANRLVADAQKEAEAMRAQAQAETEAMKKESAASIAHEKEQARLQGYQEGLEQAKRENRQSEQEWKQKMQALDEAYQQQIDELEPQLVDTITGIYEHIFNLQLDSYRDVLIHLISTTMRKIDGNRDFMIHVSKEDYPYVSMQKKQLLSNATGANSTVEIIEDSSLSKNECMIETEGGIFDCGLGTQLEELRRRLKLLSYEK